MKNNLFRLVLLVSFIVISSLLFANNLEFFKNYYPKKPFLYFLNTEIKNVEVVSKSRLGKYSSIYNFKKNGKKIDVLNNSGDHLEIYITENILKAIFYDQRGLWQTFYVSQYSNKVESFLWEHRFMVEGRAEPLMIKEENLFKYENGLLISHGNSSKYSSRIFNYSDAKLNKIINTIGNGEREWIVEDNLVYTSDTDYVMTPSSELKFYSLHYPTMDKKVHTEVTSNNVTTIKDTYYYNDKIYYETIEEWSLGHIVSIITYKNIKDSTTKFTFNYK